MPVDPDPEALRRQEAAEAIHDVDCVRSDFSFNACVDRDYHRTAADAAIAVVDPAIRADERARCIAVVLALRGTVNNAFNQFWIDRCIAALRAASPQPTQSEDNNG